MRKYLKMSGFVLLYTFIYIGIDKLIRLLVEPILPEQFGTQLFYLSIEIPVFIILLTLSKIRRVKIRDQIRAKKISPKIILISLIIGISTALFTSSALSVLSTSKLDIPFNSTNIFLFLLFHLENSVYKEVYYRGYIFNEMRGKIHIVFAIFIEGLIYGILFMGPNLPAIAYGYLGVILFTMIYIWTDSLWSGVIVQFSSTIGIYLLTQTNLNIINPRTVRVFLIMGGMMLIGSIIWLRISSKKNVPLKEKTEKSLSGIGLVALTTSVLMASNVAIYFVHDFLWNKFQGYAQFMQSNGNIITIIFCSVAVGVMALIFKKLTGSVVKEWNIKKMSRRSIILISCIGIGIALFTTSLTSISAMREAFPVFEQYMDAFMSNMSSLPLQILCILAIPLLEEIIFRGIIFYQLRKKSNLILALVISVSLYAMLQGNILIGIYSILGSVIYTLCFEFGASLWGAVLVQEVSAIMMMVIRRTAVLKWFNTSSNALLVILCLLSIIGIVCAFVFLNKEYRKQTHIMYEEDLENNSMGKSEIKENVNMV